MAVCNECKIPAEDLDLSTLDITYEEYVVRVQGEPLFTEAEDYHDYLSGISEDMMTLEEYIELAQSGEPMYENSTEWFEGSYGE